MPLRGTGLCPDGSRGLRSPSLAWPPASDLGRSAAAERARSLVNGWGPYSWYVGDAPPPSDRDAAELREFLADRDVGCPGCGYDLRESASARCSECGAQLSIAELRTRLDVGFGRQRSPKLALVVVAAWVLLFASSMLRLGTIRGGDGQAGLLMIPAFLGSVPALVLAVMLLPAFSRPVAGTIRVVAQVGAAGMIALAGLVWL